MAWKYPYINKRIILSVEEKHHLLSSFPVFLLKFIIFEFGRLPYSLAYY